jgi:predicted AlkP superfamily pyrophosphatase or phosphodiesterase
MIRFGKFLIGLACLALSAVVSAAPVLLISIDGLRPADVTEAQARGLKVPNLRRFLADGASASGVVGVLPTVTYPSHTTLLTGASPGRHGIVSNTTFDPMQINYGGWYWYATDIKVPTLWDAARGAGLSVANVHWPVSVGATSITWNLPQIWRSGHSDDAKLIKALATAGLVGEFEAQLGPYAAGIDESIESDENRGRFAAALISAEHPDFATVYLTALDHMQHLTGPGSSESHAVLERIDAIVGMLVATETRARPDAVVAVVSDHGFDAVDTEINLFRPFIDAGLINVDDSDKVKSWDAMPWPSGGSIAVVLRRPDDQAIRIRVRALLAELQKDPKAKISKVIEAPAIAAAGANPDAAFYVNLARGAMAANFTGKAAPLSAPSHYKGMHGYFPAAPEMRSTFLIMGGSIPRGRNLGEIDMRAIAPTLAKILGVELREAEKQPLF